MARHWSFSFEFKRQEVYLNDCRTFTDVVAAFPLHRRGIEHKETALRTGLSCTGAVRGATRPRPGPIPCLKPVQPKGFTPSGRRKSDLCGKFHEMAFRSQK
jgi:hypothetical protein